MDLLTNSITAFLLGLATPLTAVCVLPLYPGFLSFLANQLSGSDEKFKIIKMGLLVSLGVISFMTLLGLIFSLFLQVSLTQVIGIVSPIAFGILGIISILLIFNVNFSRFMPHFATPQSSNPYLNAFLYGFFFGAIIIPCNPGFIAAFFTRIVGVTDFTENMIQFLSFGIGIAAPLLILSLLSLANSRGIIGILTKYQRGINVVAGLIMLVISLYYLIFVFGLHELII